MEKQIKNIIEKDYFCCGDLTGKCDCIEKNNNQRVKSLLSLLTSEVEKERERMYNDFKHTATDIFGEGSGTDMAMIVVDKLKEQRKALSDIKEEGK